ncbi:MAG: CBS domain-containing protein [Deltaproteobacteria bacterium]|nr:CBS domain-containing protein [Deltaproteobacteria bacterium]
MNTRIRDILRRKGEDVYSVGPLATVIDAVHMMNDHHVGSVLVCEGGDPVGVFSERDVVMTTRLHTATPDDTLLDVMRLMTERRCRHVPVMEGGRLLGMVSIGDLTKETQRNLHQEVRELSSYIGGPYLS